MIRMNNIVNHAAMRAKMVRLESINAILLSALKECDEAMVYMSEYDIPLTLPETVKIAIAKAEQA